MNEKELSLHIGFRLLSFRITQRLTRKELAAALGISYSGISRLERGFTHRLSAIFLNNCHVKFGLSVDWLLTGQGPMVLPMAKFKMSPPKLRHQKGGKRRLGRVSALADQRDLQRKLDELTVSLTRTTLLAQEFFAHATGQDARAKGK